METLETSLETIVTPGLSVRPKWKQFGNTILKWKHPARRHHPGPQRSELRRGTQSTGLAARINSTTEVQKHDEQIHDDKASGERTRSFSGNCGAVGA